MADTGIFGTTDEVVRKAGAGVSVSAREDIFINDVISQSESEINVATLFNWSDSYASLDVDTKGILKQAATNNAAIYCISYDMSGYTTRSEAESMINILRDAFLRCIGILKDKKKQAIIVDPSKGTV